MKSPEHASPEPERLQITRLKNKLEDLPQQGPECVICGSVTERTTLEHSCGNDVIVETQAVPGYRCEECGMEYYSQLAIEEVLETAAGMLQAQGDELTSQHLLVALAHSRSVAARN